MNENFYQKKERSLLFPVNFEKKNPGQKRENCSLNQNCHLIAGVISIISSAGKWLICSIQGKCRSIDWKPRKLGQGTNSKSVETSCAAPSREECSLVSREWTLFTGKRRKVRRDNFTGNKYAIRWNGAETKY